MISFERCGLPWKKGGCPLTSCGNVCGIDSKTIRRLRANENIETKTLDKLCAALSCRLEEIAEYRENS